MHLTINSGGRAGGVIGKLVACLFFSLFAGMGLLFCGFIIMGFWQAVETRLWHETNCHIMESRVSDSEDNDQPYRFIVRYSYNFKGNKYTSDLLDLDYSGTDDYSEAQRSASNYKKGTTALCYVNPENPQQAILEHKSLLTGLAIFFPMIFVAIGFGGIWYTLRSGRSRENDDGTIVPESISQKASKDRGSLIGLLFFSVFFLIGLAFLTFAFIIPAMNIQSAKSWSQVRCHIVRSSVQSHYDDDGTTYSVEILYSYKINDVEYRSDRYSFMGGSSSGYESKKRIVDSMPPGSEAACYVNPDDPTDAVLNRDWTVEMWFGLIPLAFVLVGGGGMIAMVRSKRKRKYRCDAEMTIPYEAVLKSGSRVAKFIGHVLFAIFWNGIVVGLFIWDVPLFFSIIFAVAGAAIFLTVVYKFLALFNPSVSLVMSPGKVVLGEETQLMWEMSGNIEKVEQLTITVEGQELATYRRGTDTCTDSSIFMSLQVLDTTDFRDMETGKTSFTLTDTMHSFKADNNEIRWTVKVTGDIPNWPDIKEKFGIGVLPHRNRK